MVNALLVLLALFSHSQVSTVRSMAFKMKDPIKIIGRSALIRESTLVHSCPNLVYCQGELLDTVQKHKLYKDSKTFVDMSQKNDEKITLENFWTMMNLNNGQPSKKVIEQFVVDNFEFINETESWTPTDQNLSPTFLNNIEDPNIKSFAKSLVSLWPLMGRRIKDSVKANPTRHSLIPVPEGFIVPGGRFREIYYWDSYWIIKGLLISEMTTTARGMLTNFAYFVKHYGFIPNGSRIYYLNRSQPPLFTLMVGIYIEYTNDMDWLRSNIQYIEKELVFWLVNRTVKITKSGSTYELAHFGTDSNTPRPESYSEDLETCERAGDEAGKQGCYNALKTACETGWDFSTRWIFDKEGSTNSNLSDVDSQRVIPADLNAFLCTSFQLLANFYGKLGNSDKQKQWKNMSDLWHKNIEMFLYNEIDGIWYDYDYNLGRQRKYFFPSNLAPLWAGCYDKNKKNEHGKKAVAYIKSNGIDQYMGGIPTSLQESGEQWDLPNAWPPLQEFVVLGLYDTGNAEAQEMAKEFANRWIISNMKGYDSTGAMYEKYDAFNVGQYGGGGEYEIQLGFGWTNGVALSFINKFCSNLVNGEEKSSERGFRIFSSKHFYFVEFTLVATLMIF